MENQPILIESWRSGGVNHYLLTGGIAPSWGKVQMYTSISSMDPCLWKLFLVTLAEQKAVILDGKS